MYVYTYTHTYIYNIYIHSLSLSLPLSLSLLGKTKLKVTCWKNEFRMVCKGIFFPPDEVLVRYFRIQRQRETRVHYKSLKYCDESSQHTQSILPEHTSLITLQPKHILRFFQFMQSFHFKLCPSPSPNAFFTLVVVC